MSRMLYFLFISTLEYIVCVYLSLKWKKERERERGGQERKRFNSYIHFCLMNNPTLALYYHSVIYKYIIIIYVVCY
jgi:hypothetical protein